MPSDVRLRIDSDPRRAAEIAALVDRIQMLRTVLPTMASDLAHARREIQQLRRENARLKQHLSRGPSFLPGDADEYLLS